VNRGLSFAISALQALIIAAVTIGLVIAPLTLAWFIEGDGSVDWMVAFRVAAYAFLLACGVPLQFNAGEILGGRLVRHPQNTPAILGFLKRHALAHATKSTQIVVSQQSHVVCQCLIAACAWGGQIEHGFLPCCNLWIGHIKDIEQNTKFQILVVQVILNFILEEVFVNCF
jgi:hypothetical protein